MSPVGKVALVSEVAGPRHLPAVAEACAPVEGLPSDGRNGGSPRCPRCAPRVGRSLRSPFTLLPCTPLQLVRGGHRAKRSVSERNPPPYKSHAGEQYREMERPIASVPSVLAPPSIAPSPCSPALGCNWKRGTKYTYGTVQ